MIIRVRLHLLDILFRKLHIFAVKKLAEGVVDALDGQHHIFFHWNHGEDFGIGGTDHQAGVEVDIPGLDFPGEEAVDGVVFGKGLDHVVDDHPVVVRVDAEKQGPQEEGHFFLTPNAEVSRAETSPGLEEPHVEDVPVAVDEERRGGEEDGGVEVLVSKQRELADFEKNSDHL